MLFFGAAAKRDQLVQSLVEQFARYLQILLASADARFCLKFQACTGFLLI